MKLDINGYYSLRVGILCACVTIVIWEAGHYVARHLSIGWTP